MVVAVVVAVVAAVVAVGVAVAIAAAVAIVGFPSKLRHENNKNKAGRPLEVS